MCFLYFVCIMNLGEEGGLVFLGVGQVVVGFRVWDVVRSSSNIYRRVVGFVGEDVAGFFFGYVEVFQVGIVDVFGEGFQVSYLWVVLICFICCQFCYQFFFFGFWYLVKVDGCRGGGIVIGEFRQGLVFLIFLIFKDGDIFFEFRVFKSFRVSQLERGGIFLEQKFQEDRILFCLQGAVYQGFNVQ